MSKFHAVSDLREDVKPKSDYGLSLRKLLKMFNRNFYKNIQDQETFFQYLTAISDAVCRKYGVETTTVFTGEMGMCVLGGGGIGVRLNESLINAFPKFARQNNLFYVFKCIETVIHETRHYLQDSNGSKYLHIDPLLKKFSEYKFVMSSGEKKCISYETNPIEIDARYYAFQTLKRAGGLFDKYLLHPIGLFRELKKSKKSTSIARSLNETFGRIEELDPYRIGRVEELDEEYSSFLKTMGLTREDFLIKRPTKKQMEGHEKVKENDEAIHSLNGIASQIEKGEIKTVEQLNEELDEVKEKFAIDDSVLDIYASGMKLIMLENYERDALYERLAPGYAKIFQKKDFFEPKKGMKKKSEEKITQEMIEFDKIYTETYNADQEKKKGMQ